MVVKELMFLICAIIGDIPLSESVYPTEQQLHFAGSNFQKVTTRIFNGVRLGSINSI